MTKTNRPRADRGVIITASGPPVTGPLHDAEAATGAATERTVARLMMDKRRRDIGVEKGSERLLLTTKST